jgi:hypothetical protein
MATTNLAGPYPLMFDTVHAVVPHGAPGVFALGYTGRDGAFYVNYIGRSDNDVRARLLDFIGSDVAFKFNHSKSAEEAFRRECEVFHAFRPPANRMHPSRPAFTDWKCPRCSFLEW